MGATYCSTKPHGDWDPWNAFLKEQNVPSLIDTIIIIWLKKVRCINIANRSEGCPLGPLSKRIMHKMAVLKTRTKQGQPGTWAIRRLLRQRNSLDYHAGYFVKGLQAINMREKKSVSRQVLLQTVTMTTGAHKTDKQRANERLKKKRESCNPTHFLQFLRSLFVWTIMLRSMHWQANRLQHKISNRLLVQLTTNLMLASTAYIWADTTQQYCTKGLSTKKSWHHHIRIESHTFPYNGYGSYFMWKWAVFVSTKVLHLFYFCLNVILSGNHKRDSIQVRLEWRHPTLQHSSFNDCELHTLPSPQCYVLSLCPLGKTSHKNSSLRIPICKHWRGINIPKEAVFV